PNQVNNVLGFPFIFRGALDVRDRGINTEMMVAAAEGLARLSREPVPDSVLQAYARSEMVYGTDYIITTPFDPRLKDYVASAVAQAAVESGLARAPYPADYPPIKPG
ncbi:MAG: malate dehydrogenase, partial [Gammaproteobacteria bacterium]